MLVKGIEILNELKAKSYYSLGYLFMGELFMQAEVKEKAIANLEKAREMFKEMGMDYWLDKTQEVLDKL